MVRMAANSAILVKNSLIPLIHFPTIALTLFMESQREFTKWMNVVFFLLRGVKLNGDGRCEPSIIAKISDDLLHLLQCIRWIVNTTKCHRRLIQLELDTGCPRNLHSDSGNQMSAKVRRFAERSA